MENTYVWDTKEKQELKKPYGFVDFPDNFLDIYKQKRERVIKSLKENLKQTGIKPQEQTYSDEELEKLEEFNTQKIIFTLYNSISYKNTLTKSQLKHFWRILKKIEVKKLTASYDSNFINYTKEPLNFESYVYLALTFLLYSKLRSLGYLQALSTALKLNDFLISEIGSFNNIERTLLSESLKLEKEQIEKTMQEALSREPEEVIVPKFYKQDPPVTIKNLGMLLQETNRSKAYLQKLIKSGLYPNFVLLLRKYEEQKENLDKNPKNINTLYFNPNISEQQSLEQAKISYKIIQADSCNELQVVNELKQRPEEYFVFSGRGILKEVFDNEKKFIHIHPGKLPEYRGSTCPYYSFLAGHGWNCTSFLMKIEVDKGDVITEKKFPLPGKGIDSTRIYDPYTRSETLIDAIKQLAETGTLKTYSQNFSKGIDYYLIHPVLEFIAKKSL